MQQQQEIFLPQLIMVTEPDLKAKAIGSYLQKNMKRHVNIISHLDEAKALLKSQNGLLNVHPSYWDEQLLTEPYLKVLYGASFEARVVLVLLDVEYLDFAAVNRWWQEFCDCSQVVLALFNVANEDDAVQLMGMGKFDGVIYNNIGLEMMEKGVEFMLNGQMWLSRGLMARLINEMLSSSAKSVIDSRKLTRRETQILRMIGVGVSNAEIGEQLFISEHTVKTHIYNIYKKINVHNREEAKKWVKNNFH